MRKLALLCVSTLLSLLLLEGLCSYLAWHNYSTLKVQTIAERDSGNAYSASRVRLDQIKRLKPHPYLGIVEEVREKDWRWQSADMTAFPLTRDPSTFTVLLLGGSVAEDLGVAGENGKRFLEDALTRTLDTGSRPVRVLNAAMGATRQPRQSIALQMYADVVDAVISVDGFNELGINRESHARLESPGKNWFFDMHPLAEHDIDSLIAARQKSRWRARGQATGFRSAYFFCRAMERFNQSSSQPNAVDEFFSLPGDWSGEQVFDYNTAQLAKYTRFMHATAEAAGIRAAYFIQPCAAIDKPLSDDERACVGGTEYAGRYRRQSDALLRLRSEQVPVVCLLDVFDGRTETIYGDPVHCNAIGYRIMAERIATDLARLWNEETAQK
jgi:lysophospholipase L1-like esterase